MAHRASAAEQRRRDVRQVRQHYVHWGVKVLVSLLVAALMGAAWLVWIMISGAGG